VEREPIAAGAEPPPRAVLWDLDGTLVDSRDHHWRAWRAAMETESVRITEEDFRATFGQRNEEILALWLGADIDPDRVRRIGDAKDERYRALVREHGVEPLPGAAEWVGFLDAAGWRQAIASSAPRLNVEAVADVLPFAGLMGAVVAAEDVRVGKPDPEVFLTAAKRLDVEPTRCVVVEDADAGIEAARRAGMRSVAVGGATGGDLVVGSLEGLAPDRFERLIGIERGRK
jgi:beta-phosphoglucomutase